ncbi:2-isopropylmalate synthase [uncultured Intestinimonas sp.]|uniref:2-isopropylmalate synthase n=1 Tax=uncultured Intestinimonas sp. TaxID=1689265 RepID=UPI0025E2EA8B|nr:2-isopropylmalate synthase [uncultured Intestinimonas sp.]
MVKDPQNKYIPFVPLKMTQRSWPDNQLTHPPIWCSVDLRDGNQALVDPMNVEEKLELFHTLVDIGVKEIEVGFPSASETEFEFLRALIDGGHIPDDVTIQVLVQAREHLIRRTFEAIDGAKHVIFHFYNSTSTLQRKVVFHTGVDGVKQIAVDAANLIRELSQSALDSGMDLRYEYSPESFMGTEMDAAVEICQAVLEALQATPERKVILNLPTTVENCMPNYFADEIEYFISKLPSRDCAIISLHPHNDRGEGVATAELGQLAGAERVEATLFGNGERTGNVDMVTLALNLYTQGVDPGLDFSDINKIRDVYERVTKMKIGERQPYVGELVFTAFSGSHQDAINKGTQYMEQSGSALWEVPYLPIDPADVGRQYEPHSFGFDLPKAMHPEFGHIVQVETDRVGKELKPDAIYALFKEHYIDAVKPYELVRHSFAEFTDEEGHSHVTFAGTLRHKDTVFQVQGSGNGPIDAFFNAIHGQKMDRFTFVDYKEHAIQAGSDSLAVAYIQLKDSQGKDVFGVGISHNINLAPLKGILSAINRSVTQL